MSDHMQPRGSRNVALLGALETLTGGDWSHSGGEGHMGGGGGMGTQG
jgi:hypothetical protein